MGSRERKRQERRKRKRRSAERAGGIPSPEGATTAEAAAEPVAAEKGTAERTESFQERMARRSEQRNAEARAGLKPLAEGERPTAVTVGAIVSTVLAIVLTVSAVLAIAGVEAGGREVRPVPVVLFALVIWAMAWGMWRARYWAVLGFQMLLVLVLLASGLGLVQVSTIPQAVASVILLGASGALFYFLIRAMARIQMPERPGDSGR